jgi:hypothetical protein
MKNAKTLFVVGAIFVALVLGCGGGKPVPSQYQGTWQGTDGTTIYMYSDGKAGFEMKGKNVEGGGAELDESAKTLKISLMGIGHTWKIDSEPEDGEMVLDGVRFTRQ